LLEQQHVAPAGLRQVVGDAAAGDPATDHDHLRTIRRTGLYHFRDRDYSGRPTTPRKERRMSAEAGIDELLDLVPELRGDRTVSELVGGLTNTNYKVVTAAGAFVVRVSAKDAGMLAIDRENEYLNSVAAADAGVGAPVIGYLPERSLLVLGFVEGQTQSAEDLRRGDKLAMVADGCTAPAASATTSTCSTSSGGTWRLSRTAASGCRSATSSSSRRCARWSRRWPSATR